MAVSGTDLIFQDILSDVEGNKHYGAIKTHIENIVSLNDEIKDHDLSER